MDESFHVAIIVNTTVERYHPMPFKPMPRPSDRFMPGELCRHKSIGHHTVGFATLAEAEVEISSHANWWQTGLLFSWDGSDVPATIWDFPVYTRMELVTPAIGERVS